MKVIAGLAIFHVLVNPAATDAFIPSNFVALSKVDTLSLMVMKPSPSPVSSSTSRKDEDVFYYNHDSSLSLSSASFDPSSAVSFVDDRSTVGLIKKVTSNSLVQSIASATLFVLIERIIKTVFSARNIVFPSSLAGCCAMAFTLLINPFHARMYEILSPGAKLLQRFLMIFLVPNLIVLPLCGGCGSITEIAKIFTVIFGGFLFSLLTTSGSVCVVRKMFNRSCTEPVPAVPTVDGAVVASTSQTAKPKVFSDELTIGSRWVAIGSGLAAVISKTVVGSTMTTPLLALSMLAGTVHNFCFGARMSKAVTKVFHPLVTCTTLTWVWSYVLGAATGTDFLYMIRSYRVGGPLLMGTSGAGDFLTFILGPAVVSLGVSIYERRLLIRQNLKEVVTATGVSCLGGLLGTSLAVRLLCLASAELRLSLLPRNITSALAVAIAEIVGANKSLAVSFAIITGLIGANFGASLLDYFGVKDPVARGLAIGSAAHGLGTAAFVDEKDAFPFAAISMAFTAICGTLLVSLPVVKKLALQIALGGV